MRITIFILSLIFFFHNLIGQDNHIYKHGDCEIINGETVNCGDSKNKNGDWVHYKVGITSHTDFVDAPSQYSEEKTFLYLISKGKYLNNFKVGKWIFYSDYKSYEPQYIDKIVNYDMQSQKDSIEIEFYNDSTIMSKTFWDNGVKDSVIVLYPGERLKFQGTFSQNKIQEFWIYYSDGTIKYHGNDIIDNLVKSLIFYDTEGIEKEILENDISVIAMREDIIRYID